MSGRKRADAGIELASFADPVVCCLCAFSSKLTAQILLWYPLHPFGIMVDTQIYRLMILKKAVKDINSFELPFIFISNCIRENKASKRILWEKDGNNIYWK